MIMFLFSKHNIFLRWHSSLLNSIKCPTKNYAVATKPADYKQSLKHSIAYDDIRLQKHLKWLGDVLHSAQGNRTYVKEKCGFNQEVLSHILSMVQEVESATLEIKDLDKFISDLKEQKDDLLSTAESEQKTLQDRLNAIKDEVLELIIPEDTVDDKDIILELAPGVGGQEAMLFTKDMFDMYCNYALWKGWNCEILKYDTTDIGGMRNVHVGMNGKNAFKILKYESGVHRVQRVPKTERSGRVHTSTMTVAVLPQPSEIDIVIHPNDIEMEFKRSSGAGGQNVNVTDSCVRIHHKPTGIVTESQMERDQHKNKQLALKALRAKLYERELEAVEKETKSSRKMQIGTSARSEKVRTYNFAQDRITDHRAQISVYNLQSFMKGEEHLNNLSNMLQTWSHMQSLVEILNKYNS